MFKHFTNDEFRCKCCEELPVTGMNTKLLDSLDELRDKVGKSVFVSSGYRCSSHNDTVGGVKGSYHTLGMAADIFVVGLLPVELARICLLCGFTGLGIYDTFVHVDVRESDEIIIFKGGELL